MYNYNLIEEDCASLRTRLNTENLIGKSVLITGANGLIGSFIADFLCSLNRLHDYEMKIFLTSFSLPEKAERIKHLIDSGAVTYFRWDASTNFDSALINKEELDIVLFCSGYGQPAKFTKDIVKTSFINTIGVNSILEFLSTFNKKSSFLFISTSEIYGDPDVENIPTKEEYNGGISIDNNRASYVLSKQLGEVITKSYYDKVNVKIARVGLIYGPGTLLGDNRVMQEFIFKAHKNKIISLLDSGLALRNYLYLTDGVEMLLNIILNSQSKNLVYNVGGDQEPVTIRELARKIAKILDCEVEFGNDLTDAVSSAPKNVYMSMDKYRSEFSKHNNSYINLDNGLMNVIRWYKLK